MSSWQLHHLFVHAHTHAHSAGIGALFHVAPIYYAFAAQRIRPSIQTIRDIANLAQS